MRALALSLACAGLVAGASGSVAPAYAAPAKKVAKPKASAPKSAEETQSAHAVLYLKVLINALQSDEVKEEAKASLVACLYSHTLREITTAADEVFAKAPEKVNRDKPAQVLFVLTGVCGLEGDPRKAATSGVPKGR